MSIAYMPEAIGKRAGEVGMGLLTGLLQFAKDAVAILAISTAVGALIGALFGGVGAIPGAEIGFEIGLLILEYYGLATLIQAVLAIAVDLVVQLGKFISVVWNADGDKKQLDLAARTLADAIGILVSAILIAVAAYLLKKGGEALGKTKFAKTVGETRLTQWFKKRQQLKTTLGEKGTLGKFANDQLLQDHFARHGRDFGARTPGEYAQQAGALMKGSPPSGVLQKVRPNGDIVRYRPATQEFGVAKADGTIRTYFKPDPSVHGYLTNLEYFNVQ
jgi:hypothetical protein